MYKRIDESQWMDFEQFKRVLKTLNGMRTKEIKKKNNKENKK